MKKLVSVAAVLGCLCLGLSARADTFQYTISGGSGGYSGTGTITATGTAGGPLLITGLTAAGLNVSLLAPGTFGGNDNLLFPTSSPVLDYGGLSFFVPTPDDQYRVNISGTADGYTAYILNVANDLTSGSATFTLNEAPVPEPSSLVLLGSGMLGLIGVARRKILA